jgi:hypothetical protein
MSTTNQLLGATTRREPNPNDANNSRYENTNGYRQLKVGGKVIIEIQKDNAGTRQIIALKLEDGTILSAQEVADAFMKNQTEGIQVVAGSTTDDLVIKSVRGYAERPLSALPQFY